MGPRELPMASEEEREERSLPTTPLPKLLPSSSREGKCSYARVLPGTPPATPGHGHGKRRSLPATSREGIPGLSGAPGARLRVCERKASSTRDHICNHRTHFYTEVAK
ncbi:hypothetical protein AV530_005257 [Patagioenas fasciata monilis]|uniref:Uncharacterized protein n=1 Tax=Patagioenas fasciata monilis TaxID=372326 RepID=A0A1V4JKM2_PATFA|nr:hypothetical protein AV530_005257 [Patagioenas fasciata monilis]